MSEPISRRDFGGLLKRALTGAATKEDFKLMDQACAEADAKTTTEAPRLNGP